MDYSKVLGYSNTRWLALLPTIKRVLKLFNPLKAYFASIPKCPVVLQNFFSDPTSEAWLYFVHAQAAYFQSSIVRIEGEKVLAVQSAIVLDELSRGLRSRREQVFIPTAVTACLKSVDDQKAEDFKRRCIEFYSSCEQYLQPWFEHYQPLLRHDWVLLRKSPEWVPVQETAVFIESTYPCGQSLYENEMFDNVSNARDFVSKENLAAWESTNASPDERWAEMFQHFARSDGRYAALASVVQFLLCLPGSNAPCERVFSQMNNLWTPDKHQLKVETLGALLMVKFNFSFTCTEFHDFLMRSPQLLESIHSSDKY